ncbi:MAG: hypothetical protein ACRCW9_03870 [Cetobacterium sp.]
MYDLILKKKAIFILRTIVRKLNLLEALKEAENKITTMLECILDNLEVVDLEITILLQEIYTDVNFDNISAVEYIVLINEVFEANQSFFTKVRSDLILKMKSNIS